MYINEESTVLISDQEYNVNVVKTSVKCSEPHRLGEVKVILFLGKLCFLTLIFLCNPSKNVIKNK